jgi:hypothetical protein
MCHVDSLVGSAAEKMITSEIIFSKLSTGINLLFVGRGGKNSLVVKSGFMDGNAYSL